MKKTNDENVKATIFVVKEFAIWLIAWMIIIVSYFILGIRLNIIEPPSIIYVGVGIILGTLIIRTNIKIKSSLILLDELSNAIYKEEKQNRD